MVAWFTVIFQHTSTRKYQYFEVWFHTIFTTRVIDSLTYILSYPWSMISNSWLKREQNARGMWLLYGCVYMISSTRCCSVDKWLHTLLTCSGATPADCHNCFTKTCILATVWGWARQGVSSSSSRLCADDDEGDEGSFASPLLLC